MPNHPQPRRSSFAKSILKSKIVIGKRKSRRRKKKKKKDKK